MNSIAKSIAERIKLVTLHQPFWGTKKQNKEEGSEVKARHHLADRIDPTVYVPIAVDPTLDALRKLRGQIYTQHKLLTCPSIQDGQRVLPNGKEMEHSNLIREFRPKWNVSLQKFLNIYDQLRLSAPAEYGDLYNPKHWPPKSVVEEKFGLECFYLPCPTDGAWADWLEQTAQVATADYRERIVAKARHLVEKCRNSDGRIFRSVITGLNDICAEDDNYNLSDDPIIREAICKFDELTAGLSVEALRENTTLRTDTARRAEEILSLLGT